MWNVCESCFFEFSIQMCIIGNIIALSMTYETESNSYKIFVSYLNLIFSSVFVLECIIKMIGYGINGYFFKSINKFAFLIVLASIADIIFTYFYK